jgi:uncharacterized protein YndB with AHSA1/START domain
MDLSPIKFEYEVDCAADDAFATYTERIGEWWDPRYTANADTFESVTISPRVGGRIVERHSDGREVDWGEVREWEPGRRLVHTFALAQDPARPSEVRADFEPQGEARCTVRFAHGGWSEANAEHRKKFGDWPVLLGRFQDLCSAR